MFIGAHEWSLPEVNSGQASLSLRPLTTADPEPVVTVTNLYRQLMKDDASEAVRKQGANFLRIEIAKLDSQACELPESVNDLQAWMASTARSATSRYSAYLEQRKAGAPRRYFSNRSHALYFLRSVAPTKLVDGAWLFGLLKHWRNPRFADLLHTYVEELGEGAADKNHVLIYRQLMTRYGIDPLENLDDALFTQGLIQLVLGHHAEQFLPEIVGFNLGYEQLPLHLLITAYELNELGLDPYYFTLHVTVDNADTGHAMRAVQAVLDTLPTFGDANDFWRRVRTGCQLGEAGIGTCAVIEGFNIEQEVMRIFARKSSVGHGAHSDFCRIAGRSVNSWLTNADEVPAFLAALMQTGWIKRGEPVENSRFWHLLQGQRAEMFGVFSAYELQIIHDWIRGDVSADGAAYNAGTASGDKVRHRSFRVETRLAEQFHHSESDQGSITSLLDPDVQAMQQALMTLGDAEREKLLLEAMSPARHWTPAGLYATRIFCQQQL